MKNKRSKREFFFYSLFCLSFTSVTGYFSYIAYMNKDYPVFAILGLNAAAFFFSFFYTSIQKFFTEKLHSQEVEDANKFDTLTDLPHAFEFRDLIQNKIKENIEDNEAKKLRGYYITIGLDKFKVINDIFGFAFADEIMIMVSKELKQLVGENDILGRLQGDEFGIVTFQKEEHISIYVKNIEKAFSKLYKNEKDGAEAYISSKIGIAAWNKDYNDELSDIMKKSSNALSNAKATNTPFKIYNRLLEKENSEILEMENDLRLAIKNEEIEVFFQPKSSCDGKVKSAEALARWFSKRKGFVRPDLFIKSAEDLGLINELGYQIMEKSIKEVGEWNRSGFPELVVAINVSTKQFTSELPEQITRLLKKHKVFARNVEIEITESALVSDKDSSIELLNKIKDTGVSIAIDDFGTGYSSLSYLVDFPLDVVKIDKSFCDKLLEPQEDVRMKGEAVISTVIHLSHKLNCKVVAEGVEEKSQLEFLNKEKCDLIQGYYFSKPLKKEDFFDYIKNN